MIGNAAPESFQAPAQLRAFARCSFAVARERAETQQHGDEQRDDDDEACRDQNDLVHDVGV